MAGTPSTKTIYGGLIQTFQWLGKQYVAPTNTTLNELYNIHALTAIGGSDRMVTKYISIGNRGHVNQVGADGIGYFEYNPHNATDAGLYKPLPFIMRPINADLTAGEQELYGMRVPVTLTGGAKYWAYYLRVLDLSGTTPEMQLTTVEGGVSTSDPFVPNNSNLTPVPPLVPNDAIQTANGVYASVSAIVPVVLSESEVEELINCAELLYGNADLAMITEIAIVSGIGKFVTKLDDNRQPLAGLTYPEVLRSTIVNFAGANFSAAMNSGPFGMDIDLGTFDPLFGTAQIEAET